MATSPIKSLLEAAQMIVEENGGRRNKVPSSDFDIVYDVGFQQPLSSSSPDMKIPPHSAALQEIHPPLVRVASAASPARRAASASQPAGGKMADAKKGEEGSTLAPGTLWGGKRI